MANYNNDKARAEPSKSNESITDYKKAYEELKGKVEVYKIWLKEKEQQIREYEKKLSKSESETKPTLSRVTSTRTLKYNLIRSSRKQGDYQRDEGQRNKEKILESLARAHPNGQTIFGLTKSTELSRHKAYRHCKELIQNGLLCKERDRGKVDKYYLTQVALGSPKLQSYWLEMIGYDSLISRHTSPTSGLNERLRAFVTTLGVYNTYVLVEAVLEKEFHPFVGTNIPGIKKIRSILGSRHELDEYGVIKTRIEDAIHPAQMFLQLCRIVITKEELDRHGSNILAPNTPTTIPSKSVPSGSLPEANKAAFEELKKELTELYLEDIRQLERVRKEQAPNIAWSHLKAAYKKQRKTASTSH